MSTKKAPLLRSLTFLVDADLLSVFAETLVLDNAVFEGEEGIVAADADIVAGVDLRPALAHKDAAREHGLTVLTLDAEALRVAVAAVVGGTGTLFMSE